MQKFMQMLTNRENIVSYALGFVVGWFGANEIISPSDWVTFAPPFLGDGTLALALVVIHGAVLVTCALLLFSNTYRRFAGSVLVLVFLEVIIDLVLQTGFSPIAVRDIGLCGMAASLAVPPSSRRI